MRAEGVRSTHASGTALSGIYAQTRTLVVGVNAPVVRVALIISAFVHFQDLGVQPFIFFLDFPLRFNS